MELCCPQHWSSRRQLDVYSLSNIKESSEVALLSTYNTVLVDPFSFLSNATNLNTFFFFFLT